MLLILTPFLIVTSSPRKLSAWVQGQGPSPQRHNQTIGKKMTSSLQPWQWYNYYKKSVNVFFVSGKMGNCLGCPCGCIGRNHRTAPEIQMCERQEARIAQEQPDTNNNPRTSGTYRGCRTNYAVEHSLNNTPVRRISPPENDSIEPVAL